jgi:hypothetical protein
MRESSGAAHVSMHSLDWLASRAYYEARFGLRRKLSIWRKRRTAAST